MGFYRRRPVPPIEARQFDGSPRGDWPSWIPGARVLFAGVDYELRFQGVAGHEMSAVKGDWIVRDPDGGFRPVKAAAFRETYEEAKPRRSPEDEEQELRLLRGISVRAMRR